MAGRGKDAQKARQSAVEKYNAATGEQKKALLRDCLILAFHTLQPPVPPRLELLPPRLPS